MKTLPLKNPRISQEYGRKSTSYKKGYHTGIDLVAGENNKYVYSAGSGTVLRARYQSGPKGADPSGWGNYVIVRQKDGHDVLYAHLSQVLVAPGVQISEGEALGIQGSTGNSSGPHLHFEVWAGSWENRNDINAAQYLGIENAVGPVKYTRKEGENIERVEVVEKGKIYDAIRYGGKTYVELRAYAEQDGKKVEWDEQIKMAIVSGGKLEEIKEILKER
jgi:murein DD-endopeptidase MepM/ murein hydrolase activator NlpD